jgi:hypothetical protein
MFSAIGFQTPKFGGEDIFFRFKDQEINVSDQKFENRKNFKIEKRVGWV